MFPKYFIQTFNEVEITFEENMTLIYETRHYKGKIKYYFLKI